MTLSISDLPVIWQRQGARFLAEILMQFLELKNLPENWNAPRNAKIQ
jgi:hypothetical protein